MLIKLENGKSIGYPITNENFYQLYPETSFPYPLSSNAVEPFGFGLYEYSSQPTPSTYEKVVEIAPIRNNEGIWMQTWSIVQMTQEEIEQVNEELRNSVKTQASFLLQQTDWTESISVRDTSRIPHLINGEEFDDYRIALRVIAVNPPITISEWPIKPDEIWSSN